MLYKDTLIEIRKTFKRFLSIVLIVLLGVGFFCGVRSTSPDMKKTLSNYFKNQNVYDLEIISTSGIRDIEEFKKIDEITNISLSYTFDASTKINDNEYVFKVHTYLDNINKLVLLEGKLPTNKNEIVVEKNFLLELNYKIGDKIRLTTNESFELEELTIVGIVNSPLYMSKIRGTSKLGTGTVDYFIYINKESFKTDYYTEVYFNIKNLDNIPTYDIKYKNKIEELKNKLKEIEDQVETKKYNDQISQINTLPLPNKDELVSKVEKGKWHILSLESNVGYMSYLQDTDRIANIGKLFPVIFFVVAALICLTSMTRMVDEQRILIGTLKSLGFNEIKISFKYIVYAFLATIIGSLLGMLIGFNTIPSIISTIYQTMYEISDLVPTFNMEFAILGLILALLSTVGATIYSCNKTLKENCASLLRPVSPIPGKRILLEKISCIWNKLSFSRKVTFRNLFRYKKRFYMTIIGIAGCTALIVSGFGLRDSINGVIPDQFEEVFKYNFNVEIKEDQNKKIESLISSYNLTYLSINKQAIEISSINNNQDITLVVPTKDDIGEFITLSKPIDKEGVIVTKKLASLLGIKPNDKITLRNKDNIQKEVKVSALTRNYIGHYIYMSKDLYDKLYNDFVINDIYVLDENEDLIKDLLNEKEIVSSVNILKNSKVTMLDVMDNLELVAGILIISAGLLAFVVLYNLASVNISERKKELATIKVLGFYDKEVYNYVIREANILSFIGIIIGLFLGKILTSFLVKTCELDFIIFDIVISYQSYILAALITLVFAFIVNFVTYFNLKKIDMTTSLKSIE